MAQILSTLLMLTGTFFMLVAALGVARMPDLFIRMHSSTKSATLGMGFLMLGVALHFDEFAIWTRALAVVVFLFLTAPVAAHIIGRAAYYSGVPLWEGTLSDERREHQESFGKTPALPVQPADTGRDILPGRGSEWL